MTRTSSPISNRMRSSPTTSELLRPIGAARGRNQVGGRGLADRALFRSYRPTDAARFTQVKRNVPSKICIARRFVHGLESGDPDPRCSKKSRELAGNIVLDFNPRSCQNRCRSRQHEVTSMRTGTTTRRSTLCEEWGGRIDAAEMKWSPRSKVRATAGL